MKLTKLDSPSSENGTAVDRQVDAAVFARTRPRSGERGYKDDTVHAFETTTEVLPKMRKATMHDRPADMPIPNRLNVVLVLFDVAAAIALLWLGSHLESWLAVLCAGIAFSYLMLTNYALLHEATHDNLHENPRWNHWLGVITGVFFMAPFSMIRVTHQGHHQRNRTDAEMFDLYYPNDSFFWKCCQWYGTLTGLFWPCIPVCAVLFAIVPRTIGMQLFSGPPLGNANVKDITSSDLRRIRLELLLTLSVFTLLFWLLELRWQNTLVMYACFSFNWSTRQYIGHAFSKRDIVEGAWNLRHNRLMSWLLLHGEWDLNHHRHPELSWYYLPGGIADGEDRPGYVQHYLSQWLGPRPAGPPPGALKKSNVAQSANTPSSGLSATFSPCEGAKGFPKTDDHTTLNRSRRWLPPFPSQEAGS